MPASLHHPRLTQVGQVFRNPHLRQFQNALEVAHAQRRLRQQMHDPQPRFVRQSVVDFDQLHIPILRIFPEGILLSSTRPAFSFATGMVTFRIPPSNQFP